MDAVRFDHWTRSLGNSASRRRMIGSLITGAVALARGQALTAAGPGCKNVGAKCKKAKDCCSGICQGKKGKKTCKAHDTGGCQAGQTFGVCGGTDTACTTASGEAGRCITTTGNAGFCTPSAVCFACKRDADCQAICGPGAACVQCADDCENTGGFVCAGSTGAACGI